MHTRDLVKIALSSLLRTKGRTALTMLGIVIGIASVILMMSIGRAAQTFLLSQVTSFGSDLVFVMNGRGDVKRGDPGQLVKMTLTYDDFKAVRAQSWVRLSVPSVISADLVTFGGVNAFGQTVGTAPDEPPLLNSLVAKGRFLSDEELTGRAHVVVLGAGIAEQLFGQGDQLNQQVRINKRNFRVIGVMEHGGTRFFSELDKQMYIPATTALDLYGKDRLQFISFKPQGIPVNEAVERVRDLLRDRHKLENPERDLAKDDFRVLTQADAIKNADTIGTILQILLASIAAISLIVGGIGIMNIMFVTVTERTQEIGLRKAIGATQRDVLGQFLAEAIFLTVIGGVIGIVVGVTASYGTITLIGRSQEGWKFIFPTQAIFMAFTVSALIGIVFGYYPARKAARLSPIEALRFE